MKVNFNLYFVSYIIQQMSVFEIYQISDCATFIG